jgi:hypothetical protein
VKKVTVAVVFVVLTAFARIAAVPSTAVMLGCHSSVGTAVLKTGECILDTGVLATLFGDLTQSNYAALVTDAITQFGPALVKCALQAIAAGQQPSSGNGSDAGSGSAPPAPRAEFVDRDVVQQHALEMLSLPQLQGVQ